MAYRTQAHGGCASGNGGQLFTSTVTGEKKDMQGLNDRLSDYMARVRGMKNIADPALYQQQLNNLEDEINKMKRLYGDEMERLRKQLEDAIKERNALRNAAEQNNQLRNKLDELNHKLKRAGDEANKSAAECAQKDQELAALKALLDSKDKEIEKLKPTVKRLQHENDDLRKRSDVDATERKLAEDKARQLAEKLGFDNNLNGQEKRDLQERLRVAQEMVKKLEEKVRELSRKSDEDKQRMLEKLREQNAADLKKMQKESQDALNRQLDDIKKQAEDAIHAKNKLTKENEQLADAVRKLHSRIKELEGQLAGLEQQNRALEGALDAEKARANNHIRELEDKNRDLHDQLMGKVKDFQGARDAQASLRNEINTYKTLLDVEDGRVQSPMGTRAGGASRQGSRPATSCKDTGAGVPKKSMYKQETTYRASYDKAGWMKNRGGSSLPPVQQRSSAKGYAYA